jgi:hypothetical protein
VSCVAANMHDARRNKQATSSNNDTLWLVAGAPTGDNAIAGHDAFGERELAAGAVGAG